MKSYKAQTLFDDDCMFDNLIDFNSEYFVSHLITYIGNKRRLLPFLNSAIIDIKKILGKDKLVTFDGFSGSGAVSRLLKYHSYKVISNDIEKYAETINTAYLANLSEVNIKSLIEDIKYLNAHKLDITKSNYFISKNYAPVDDKQIKHGERVFYTTKNAKIIDNIRYLISTEIRKENRVYCLANLLIKASINTNTSGVFKGFHKKEGIGHFGGKGENALTRIMREISIDLPIFSEIECLVDIRREDTNRLVKTLQKVDLAYYDPPYNQHPYGSNYFMLNIINDGVICDIQNGVSGIVKNWYKSDYNKRRLAEKAMDDLLGNTPSKFIAISYNNEGIIPMSEFKRILSRHGKWTLYEQEYNTYKGSRNLRNRDIKVQELLWVLQKN